MDDSEDLYQLAHQLELEQEEFELEQEKKENIFYFEEERYERNTSNIN